MNFAKLIDCINDNPHWDEEDKLNIEDYIESFYIDNEE